MSKISSFEKKNKGYIWYVFFSSDSKIKHVFKEFLPFVLGINGSENKEPLYT